MTITQCDGCGAVIERRDDAIAIGRGWPLPMIELCAACGAPAAELLERIVANRRAAAEPKREIKA